MKRRAAAVLLAVVAAALAGCATPRPPPEAPALSGRMALRVAAHDGRPERSGSSQFELRGGAERGHLQLSSPLGTLLAQARWEPGRAELENSDGSETFADLDALTRRMLGEALPLAALIDWLHGRPWAGAPHQPGANGFDQLGWRVGLERFADGLVVAERAAPPAVSVRVKLDPPP